MNRKSAFKNIFSTSIISCLIYFSTSITNVSIADVINNSQWLVKSGDSVYRIARKMHPENPKLRAKFRRELVKNNPDIFSKGARQMSIGVTLNLPDFSVKKIKPKQQIPVIAVKSEIKKAQPAKEKIIITEVIEAEIITPDPEDIIGKVIINIGGLEAVNRGEARQLKRNSKIYRGDTLKTLNRTHTQIRMKDGALLSMRPNTELRIAEYNYNGSEDGTERSLLELIRGGFRTITGAIGHRNKQNYQVKTSVATIGIRGTHYGLMLCNAGSCTSEDGLKDGLYGGVVDGEITTKNESGEYHFTNDQYFHVASSQQKPTVRLIPPPIFHGDNEGKTEKEKSKETADNKPDNKPENRPEQKADNKKENHRPFVRNNARVRSHFQRNDFSPIPVKPPLTPDQDTNVQTDIAPPDIKTAPAGSGMAISFLMSDAAGNINGAGAPILVTGLNNNLIFLKDLVLSNGITATIPFGAHEEFLDTQTGTLYGHDISAESPDGSKAVFIETSSGANLPLSVVWGRWQGAFLALENGTQAPLLPVAANNNFHFIYSNNLTSPDNITALGGTRARIYKTVGGTSPTDHAGNTGLNFANIVTSIDFTNQRMDNYQITSTVNNTTYRASSGTVAFSELLSGRNFNLTGTGFDGEADLVFVGQSAGGAMSSYSIFDTSGLGGISGVSLLSPITDPVAADDSTMLYSFTDTLNGRFFGNIQTLSGSADNLYLDNTATATAGAYTPFIAHESAPLPSLGARDFLMNPAATSNLLEFGAAVQVTSPVDGSIIPVTVNWGRWDANAVTAIEDGQSIQHNELHYIYSNNLTPASQLASLTATISYSTIGGTLPTDNLGGTGTAPANISMSVNFTTQTVDSFSISASSGNASYFVDAVTAVDFANLSNGISLIESSTPSCGSFTVLCTGTALLNFIGPNAEGAITSYVIGEPDGSSLISGTALLDSQPQY